MDRYTDAMTEPSKVWDVAWWHHERTLVGFLHTAVWSTGGVAIEEYDIRKRTDKGAKVGRCDLYAVLNERTYLVEAKRLAFVSLTGLRWDRTIRAVNEAADNAFNQVKAYDENKDSEAAAVFVIPRVSPSGRSSWEEDLNGIRRARPDGRRRGYRLDHYLPLTEAKALDDGDYRYPGLSLFLFIRGA